MKILDGLKNSFRQGSSVTKLIYANLAIYLIINLIHIISRLMIIDDSIILQSLAVPASINLLIMKPWTLITYMFLHEGFFHILFNIINLFWFGKLFLMYFNQKQAVGLYILGGLSGAAFYILGLNIFPYFQNIAANSILLGASASVLAIVIGIATYSPNMEIQLAFIGKVKLKYLAAVFFFISLISVAGENAGGNIAHLGGILAGYLFAINIKKGKDLTIGINKTIDFFVDLFSRKPKMKVSHQNGRTMTDQEWNAKKAQEGKMLDEILDKIKKSGYDSLSSEEKKRLFDQSKKP